MSREPGTTTTDNPWATETPEWQKYEDQRALATNTVCRACGRSAEQIAADGVVPGECTIPRDYGHAPSVCAANAGRSTSKGF